MEFDNESILKAAMAYQKLDRVLNYRSAKDGTTDANYIRSAYDNLKEMLNRHNWLDQYGNVHRHYREDYEGLM